MNFRVGFGYDSHRFTSGTPLIIGGVLIPFDRGLAAHSDGDVLIHALCDALLGAAALKDIGTHFPDTDETYRNIDSKILLAEVMQMLSTDGWKVNNVDCTLIAEKPKIKPYIDDMVACLSPILKISPSQLSIKATTNEKMGFTGREEGIVATAIVSIVH